MSEELMIRHCSPTLAGLKTGNMFVCSYNSEEELRNNMRRWNRRLSNKGLRILPLRYRNHRALVYVYRPSKLEQDLHQDAAYRLIQLKGYDMRTSERCIAQLTRRLGESEDFPHEIGLFLGYPPEDVWGFIEKKAEDCKLVGCWKVYGDEEEARRRFRKFDKCTAVYSKLFADGRTVEKLTVAG